jgi:AcrR family transcriptional regulator
MQIWSDTNFDVNGTFVKKGEARSASDGGVSQAPRPGLRARKKQLTREAISHVATGLFIERGFDRVTVAEVAEAAQVSVNTVFNYFSTKEDLFFDRAAEVEDSPSRMVRARRPGESLVDVLRRALREALRPDGGIFRGEGIRPFLLTVEGSPALQARAGLIVRRAEERLAATLTEDSGANADDPTPQVVAAMVMGLWQRIMQELQSRIIKGEPAARYVPHLLRLGDKGLALLRSGLGDYGARKR